MSTTITIPMTTNAYHLASTVAVRLPTRCVIARHAMKQLARTRIAASARAERCSALPWPYWCETSAGRTATPTAKSVKQRRHEVGAGVQRLRDQAQAVRGEACAELERDEHDGRDHRDERRTSLGIHPASETEEPALPAGSSATPRIPESYELAMSPLKCSSSVDPEPLPLSCQWRTINFPFPPRLGAV